MILDFVKKYKLEIIVFILFILIRLPLLGNDYFNTDVFKWKTRSYDFSSGIFSLNFDQTIQKYHPGVTLMYIGTVAIKIFNLYNDLILKVSDNSVQALFGLHFVQKFLLVSVLAFAMSFIFYVLKKIFDTKYAVLAVFFISLEPFYLGLTRVFHLEGMQSTFMLASILWFYYYKQSFVETKNNQFKNMFVKNNKLFVASFFSALAMLTKTSAIYLLPFFALIELIDYFKNKKLSNFVYTYLSWFLTTFLFIFLIWPALWVAPLDVLEVLYKGIFVVGVDTDHYQFFLGKYVTDPGIIFYPIVFLLRSSYLLIIGFLSILFLTFYKKINKHFNITKKQKDFIIYNFIYIFFYLVMLSIPSKKLDRYALPFMLSAILVSTFFYYNLLNNLSKKMLKKYIFVIVFIPLISAVYYFPNYLAYYSIGLKQGIYAIEPKWMIGQSQIISYFKNIKNDQNYLNSTDTSFEEISNNPDLYLNTLSVGFQEKYYTQIYPFFRQIDSWAVIKDLTPFAVKTNYFVYPVWNDTSYDEDRFEIEFIDTIKINGVDIYNVYKRIW